MTPNAVPSTPPMTKTTKSRQRLRMDEPRSMRNASYDGTRSRIITAASIAFTFHATTRTRHYRWRRHAHPRPLPRLREEGQKDLQAPIFPPSLSPPLPRKRGDRPHSQQRCASQQ